MTRLLPILLTLTFFIHACQMAPKKWEGPTLTMPRQYLTVDDLIRGEPQALIDMSFFAKPTWGTSALSPFSGRITFQDTELLFPKEKEHYPGENIFPQIAIDFISDNGSLIPLQKKKVSTRHQSKSFWDVVVGTGAIWQEKEDGKWSRASFPLTLTDRWVGTARNCVATFVYQVDSISTVCVQCSQETADIDDKGIGNISGMLSVGYEKSTFENKAEIIQKHIQAESRRLPVRPLNTIDTKGEVADFFEKTIKTNAPTSMGAVLMDGILYRHPPKTRHGIYPYPNAMRHGLYSVTKSMAAALSLLYLSERYKEDNLFDQRITNYVPELANHPGWQGVTFSHTLNMRTGTIGSDRLEHFFSTVIAPRTAEEAIQKVAALGDAPELPGQKFNYASANLFVLSYAMQKFVEEKEGEKINYWDLVHQEVLTPIGAAHFSLLHTIEESDDDAIPILGLGALPTLDEAAKIALLLANGGRYNGQQILDGEKVTEAFDPNLQDGYQTQNDYRGQHYRHSFWSKSISTSTCKVNASYMLGFGENYVIFLPSNVLIFRFLDEHDMDIDPLIQAVEGIRSSCLED